MTEDDLIMHFFQFDGNAESALYGFIQFLVYNTETFLCDVACTYGMS